MKIKRISGLLMALTIIVQINVSASILGSESVSHSSIEIGHGASITTNSFYSDQSGVGLQTENYVEYTPNTSLVPVILNDRYLYGKNNIASMASSLLNSGVYPVMLMNSDFFSFQTGVPMSHQVIDGVLITKDTNILDAIGINADGTAFISPLSISTTINVGENTISIDNFNKYRQPYVIYMLDDKFGDTTKAADPGLNVVIGSLSGDMTIGSSITGVVESVIESNGEIEIPKGKIVLTADNRVAEDIYAQLQLFKEGDTVTINTNAEGDERWKSAKYILGCFGGRIIKDGTVLNVDEAAAPRTAFGIKADGTLVFYTIDGRQTGHSYGVRLKTLANRLKELGCVDAVNLDGGGSTGIGTIFPGNDSFSVVNKPSDGNLRNVATIIGLINTTAATGVTDKLFLYPYGGNYLSGATQKFNVLATDSNYYKAPVPSEIVYTLPDGSTSTDSSIKITGNGEFTVTASSGSAYGSATVNSYETPDSITVYNQDTGGAVNSISLPLNNSVNLSAKAYLGHKELIADDSCFTWKCISSNGNIGSIDTNGYFTASDENASGVIEVSAGEYTKIINVSVSADEQSYTDISFEETAAGQLKINFFNAQNVGIKSENITVNTDGIETAVSLEDNSIYLVFGDNMSHKVSVSAVNNAGLLSKAYYTVSGDEYSNIFVDTDSNWARKYISYMNNQGVVNGSGVNGKTYFNPSNNITRAEFAVMIANMLKIDTDSYNDKKLNFSDADSIPSWAANHIKALADLNIMQGKGGDNPVFDSASNLTRAEAVAVISRITDGNIKITQPSFTDSAYIPSWANDGFNKLYSLKVLSGYSDGSVKPLNNITRAETVKLLYEIY